MRKQTFNLKTGIPRMVVNLVEKMFDGELTSFFIANKTTEGILFKQQAVEDTKQEILDLMVVNPEATITINGPNKDYAITFYGGDGKVIEINVAESLETFEVMEVLSCTEENSIVKRKVKSFNPSKL